jgi:hypothetical protein
MVPGSHLELMTRFLLSLWQWGFLYMGHPLWREDGSVIYLYNCFSALPEQSLLGRSPAELTDIFCCLIWGSPSLEGQVPVFISPRNMVAQLYSRALSSLFVASYDSQDCCGRILTLLHTGVTLCSRLALLTTSRHEQHRKHIWTVCLLLRPLPSIGCFYRAIA